MLRSLKWQVRVALNKVGIWDFFDRMRLTMNYRRTKPHEDDFRFFQHFATDHGLFLDIGANQGQSALSFAMFNVNAPIFSIEPNPLHARDLGRVKSLLGSRFSYDIKGVGDLPGHLKFYVPVSQGVALTQETTLSKEILTQDSVTLERIREAIHADTFDLQNFECDVITVDGLALKPRFVKIDVQGAELAVLKGMSKTLGEMKPILMIENSSLDQFIGFLRPMGYHTFQYNAANHRLVKLNGHPLNVFFVHESQHKELQKKAAL